MHRPPEVDAWIGSCRVGEQEQVSWFAGRVHAADPGLSEAIKWGRLTFTVADNWHHWVCAVAVTKRGVSLMLHKGALLDDPLGLLQGEGRYLRQLPFAVAADHAEAVTDVVRSAITRQTDMLPAS
jgi:hypothetical protein